MNLPNLKEAHLNVKQDHTEDGKTWFGLELMALPRDEGFVKLVKAKVERADLSFVYNLSSFYGICVGCGKVWEEGHWSAKNPGGKCDGEEMKKHGAALLSAKDWYDESGLNVWEDEESSDTGTAP